MVHTNSKLCTHHRSKVVDRLMIIFQPKLIKLGLLDHDCRWWSSIIGWKREEKKTKNFPSHVVFCGSTWRIAFSAILLLLQCTEYSVKKRGTIPFKNTPLQEKEICRSLHTFLYVCRQAYRLNPCKLCLCLCQPPTSSITIVCSLLCPPFHPCR